MNITEEYLEVIQEEQLQEVIALVLLGIAVYDRFFSNAAKFCKEHSGLEKTSCMVEFRIGALKQAKIAVETALTSCKTKECKKKGKSAISKYIKKISQAEKKLEKLKDKLKVSATSMFKISK